MLKYFFEICCKLEEKTNNIRNKKHGKKKKGNDEIKNLLYFNLI